MEFIHQIQNTGLYHEFAIHTQKKHSPFEVEITRISCKELKIKGSFFVQTTHLQLIIT
jgi:hypothetical protein